MLKLPCLPIVCHHDKMFEKKILSTDHETQGCTILRQTPPKFTICSKKRTFFEELYQDHFGVARMLHH